MDSVTVDILTTMHYNVIILFCSEYHCLCTSLFIIFLYICNTTENDINNSVCVKRYVQKHNEVGVTHYQQLYN